MSRFVASELRFVGALEPTSDVSGTITFNATGEQVTLAAHTAWTPVFFQAHSFTAGAGPADAVLTNLSTGEIFARIVLTGQGSFAIDNQGREIGPIMRSDNGSQVVTCVVTGAGSSEFFACGANLEQLYGDPVA